MKTRPHPVPILLSLAACLGFAAERPNVLFLLVDDLGYMDIGAYNPDTFYQTPHIDRLAAEGLRFTQGYAANPVCSPTRYSIQTGKYPSRPDATNFFAGKRGGTFAPAPLHDRMDLDETTVAEALKQAGYRSAFFGKWHLGPSEEFWPEHQGYDHNVGGWARGLPRSYFAPYRNPRLDDGPKGEHLTARLADETIEFIGADDARPFFAFLSFYTVHTPLQAPAELKAKYERKRADLPGSDRAEFGPEEQVWPGGKPRMVRQLQRHPTYAAMVESMDTAVGRVLTALRERGLGDNTVVFFTSDNGGLSTSEGSPTSNLPLRGGKGWLYEGGIREPFIIKAPGVTKPGRVCDVPVISCDFHPTILELCGLTPPAGLDGRSLVPLLRGGGQLDREALYWHYPHYSNQGGFPGGAVRAGDWKLVERYEDGRVHLYHLGDDIGERRDLAAKHPDKVRDLRAKLHAWYREVDAKFLQPKGDRQPWRP